MLGPMTESERIADQLRRTFNGDAWHGPALLPLLDGLTAGQAAFRPAPGVHNIRELVHHIATWEEIALRRLQGEACSPTDAEDFPPEGPFDWSECVERARSVHEALCRAAAAFDPARLDEPAAGETYSNYFLLHGAVQHNVYHAGQIALLRKLVGG